MLVTLVQRGSLDRPAVSCAPVGPSQGGKAASDGGGHHCPALEKTVPTPDPSADPHSGSTWGPEGKPMLGPIRDSDLIGPRFSLGTRIFRNSE